MLQWVWKLERRDHMKVRGEPRAIGPDSLVEPGPCTPDTCLLEMQS